MKNIQIRNHEIGPDCRPFIVAEMSGNHNQSLERALQIVRAAANTGVQALKLQTYTADTMTLDLGDKEFFISDKDSLWSGKSLYKLYQQAFTPWEWHKRIFDECETLGLVCFSTPFDESAVDFLETLKVPCYKIASFENAHLPLIKKVASTRKPMLISTGMASIAELHETVQAARAAGCRDLILLKCTSSENTNLRTIPHMQQLFNCHVGLSDHTMGIGVAVASVVFGARIIEKHFTLRRADGGVDSAFSMEPHEMTSLVQDSERAWRSLGNINYGASEGEERSMIFRRSLFVSRDMQKGDVFSTDNVRIIRPGQGLAPKFYDIVMGRKARTEIRKGTPLGWNLIE